MTAYGSIYLYQRVFAAQDAEKGGKNIMFAIIETGGKQYKVSEGDLLFVEKLGAEEGTTVTLDRVLAVSTGSGFKTGAPYVAGATVTASVVKTGRGKKLHVLKYKAKKNEKKKIGHRQPYTKLQITAINA